MSLIDRGFSGESAFEVKAGTVLGLWGESGSGKTSIIRAIAGLDRQFGSKIVLNGKTWQSDGVFTPVHLRGLGFVSQTPSLFENSSSFHFKRTLP